MATEDEFVIMMTVRDVTEKDIDMICQELWYEYSEPLDASLGNFKLDVNRGRFPYDWTPNS